MFNNFLTSNFADASAAGPGVVPPEAPGFIAGSPLSPETPYDFFASEPASNGVGAAMQLRGIASYGTRGINVRLGYGFEVLQGGANTIGYWNEPIFAPLDAHFDGSRLPLPLAFPTHAGQDVTSGVVAAITDAHVSSTRGDWGLNAGWIQPTQTLRFVFTPPAEVMAPLGVSPALAETLGPGSPTLDGWNPLEPAIPVHGIELVGRIRGASTSWLDAALPALPGTGVRLGSFSIVGEARDGNQFGFQAIHVREAGSPITAGVLFGAGPTLDSNSQGNLPTSTLDSQRQTIVGVHQALHRGDDFALIEIGRSWYDASPAQVADRSSGGFYHLAYARRLRSAMLQLDAYRFEPRYAQIVLPYGTPENIWSVAWSWPGIWLKSTYQIADNTIIGSNREGARLKFTGSAAKFDYAIAVANYWQIAPATFANERHEGFVEGFFLPETRESSTGMEFQSAAYGVWHTSFADLSLDAVEETFHRPASFDRDYVSYVDPQFIFAASRSLGRYALVAAGYGEFGLRGSWATRAANVDVTQQQLFAGAQWAPAAGHLMLFEIRRMLTAGASATPGIPANTTGTTIAVEDRAQL